MTKWIELASFLVLCVCFGNAKMTADEICQTSWSSKSKALTADICNKIVQTPSGQSGAQTTVLAYQDICLNLVGENGYDAVGKGQWGGNLHQITDYGNSGSFFLQFCVNDVTDNTNMCLGPNDDQSALPIIIRDDPENPSSPKKYYELFSIQQVTTDVKKYGVPDTLNPNPNLASLPDTCKTYHCMKFEQWEESSNKKQISLTFNPLCYNLDPDQPDDACLDGEAVLQLCSSVTEKNHLLLDAPDCTGPSPVVSCEGIQNKQACACQGSSATFGGCKRKLTTQEQYNFIAQLNPTGHPTGWLLFTQKGELKTYCGRDPYDSQLQGYFHPNWDAGAYYGGLPSWLTAVFALALGCIFFGAWVGFFWSAQKKATVIDGAADEADTTQGPRMPFLTNQAKGEIRYCCVQCSENIPNLADQRHCPACGTLLETILVMDPEQEKPVIKRNIMLSNGGDSKYELDDGRAPQ